MSQPEGDGYWKEAHLQADARKLLELVGWTVTDTSVRRSGPGRGGFTVQPGIPDQYLQHTTHGHRVWVEYKLPGGKPRPEQVEWHEAERLAGGAVYVVQQLQDVADLCYLYGIPMELE